MNARDDGDVIRAGGVIQGRRRRPHERHGAAVDILKAIQGPELGDEPFDRRAVPAA